MGYKEVLTLPPSVLWWCCNKHHQWGNPNNRHCGLTVLETSSLKSRCPQGHVPSDISRGDSFLTFSTFWCLLTNLGGWLEKALLWSHDHFIVFPLCVPISSFLKRTQVIMDWGSPNDLIST